MALKNRYASWSPIVLVPWVFIVIVAILAGYTIHRIDEHTFKAVNEKPQEYINSEELKHCLDNLPSDNALTVDAAKSCLQKMKTTSQVFDDAAKPRLDELKWLLTIIATIGGFFAIAQGAAAWFSAQAYTKQAEDGLEEISAAQDAVKARYPLFDHIEAMRKEVYAALNNVFSSASKAPDSWAGNTEALDWNDNLFRRLSVEARQLLLSVDSFVSIDLDPGFSTEEHADILRKFSLFYRAKFLYEEGITQGSFCDLERAEAYLILAAKKKVDFTIKNDLGSLYGTIHTSVKKRNPANKDDAEFYLSKSEDAFKDSLHIEPKQQRAHYSLAVIAGRHRKQYEKAVKELQLAMDQTVWQREPSDYMKTIMFYNRACYESQLLHEAWEKKTPIPRPQITLAQADTVIDFLKKALGLSYVHKDIVNTDFNKPEGDFFDLIKDAEPSLMAKLEELRVELDRRADQVKAAELKAKASKDPPSVGKAFIEAIKLIRNAFIKRQQP